MGDLEAAGPPASSKLLRSRGTPWIYRSHTVKTDRPPSSSRSDGSFCDARHSNSTKTVVSGAAPQDVLPLWEWTDGEFQRSRKWRGEPSPFATLRFFGQRQEDGCFGCAAHAVPDLETDPRLPGLAPAGA